MARSWLAFADDEADTSYGVDQREAAFDVDFLAKARHLDVDHVVDGRRAARFLPDFARQHFTRYEMILMPKQVLEQLELACGQVELAIATCRATRDQIELEIGCL